MCGVAQARYLVHAEAAQMTVWWRNRNVTATRKVPCSERWSYSAAVWESVNHLYHHVLDTYYTYHSVSTYNDFGKRISCNAHELFFSDLMLTGKKNKTQREIERGGENKHGERNNTGAKWTLRRQMREWIKEPLTCSIPAAVNAEGSPRLAEAALPSSQIAINVQAHKEEW